MFDGKDLIGQARRVEWRRGGVKCVWDEVTDLEFVADVTENVTESGINMTT